VVSHDEIPVPRAARGVVAQNINGLHATRTGDPKGNHLNAESVSDCDAKHFRSHDGIETVFVRRDCCDPSPGVRLSEAKQALAFTRAFGTSYQFLVDLFVNTVRGLFLATEERVLEIRQNPILT
jgi:hypothetical protein